MKFHKVGVDFAAPPGLNQLYQKARANRIKTNLDNLGGPEAER